MSASDHEEEDDSENKQQQLLKKRKCLQSTSAGIWVARRTYMLTSTPDQDENVLIMDSAADQSVIRQG